MVRIFDVANGKVIPSEHCYNLTTLKAVMDRYAEERDWMAAYSYIFYMTCPNPDLNPFFDLPEIDKEELVLREVSTVDTYFSPEDPCVLAAKEFCEKLYETPTARAYKGIKIMLDKMANVLATEEPSFGRDGSAATLLRIAEKFDAVRQSFKGVYKDLQEEQQSTVRGNQNLAYDS